MIFMKIQRSMDLWLFIFAVEACVASWIEIILGFELAKVKGVEACVASWIEIPSKMHFCLQFLVEACVASWIEI